jgi:hypothetical protein
VSPGPETRREFVWTALPYGARSEDLRLTVLLTPRLFAPPEQPLTLAPYEMDGWPARLAAAKWEVQLGAPASPRSVEAFPAMRTGYEDLLDRPLAERAQAWDAIFPGDTPVLPPGPPTAERPPLRSIQLSAVAGQIQDAYAQAGAGHDGEPPARAAVAGVLGDFARIATPAAPPPPEEFRGEPQRVALAEARRFFERPESEFPADWTPTAPDLDFHRMVTLLADHPYVLRFLGLVVDLVPRWHPGPPLEERGSVRAIPRWPEEAGVASEDVTPWTSYELAADRFGASPGSRLEQRGGVLALERATPIPNGEEVAWGLVQLDLEAATLKLLNSARSISRLSAALAAGQAPFDSSEAEPLPALRSSGIAIAHLGRAGLAEEQLARTADLAAKDSSQLSDTALDADDLVRGYRVDVWDSVGREWRSLCRRNASYAVGGKSLGCVDEGYVKRTSATTGATAGSDLYIHEAIARWEGWSLVVSRPDRPIRRTESGEESWERTSPERAPDGKRDFDFAPKVEVEEGSLPRLRFGRDYRFRVRLVGLAGEGPRLDEVSGDEGATREITHKRFDPIPAPELAPVAAYRYGESLQCLVIRSDRGVSPEEYGGAHGFRALDERHVLAPKGSFHMAERHGAFDDALGAQASEAELEDGWRIASRADATLESIPGGKWLHPETGVEVGDARSDGPEGTYLALPGSIELPWLPDVPARGWTLVDDQKNQWSRRWRDGWPSLRPDRLRLRTSTSGSVETEAEEEGFELRLPQAADITLQLSSFPEAEDLAILGTLDWLDEESIELAGKGRHWLVTPARTLRLIHAVQRPLSDPGGELLAERGPAETSAMLIGTVGLHGASTGQLDVYGTWTEMIDDPAEPSWRQESRRVHIASLPISPEQPAESDFPPAPPRSPKPGAPRPSAPAVRHEFGDTRYRDVTYELIAASRFREYFDPQTGPFTAETALPRSTPVLSSARPAAARIAFTVPTFGWEGADPEPDWAEWERRRVGGGLRVYLERPWYSSGAGELLAALLYFGEEPPTEEVKRLTSEVGRDPIRTPDSTPGLLAAEDFARTALVPDPGLPLAEASAVVTAVPFEVSFSEERRLWYSDIELPRLGTDGYFPFVCLALARYQPNSLSSDLKLSPVARTEFVQVFPDRTLELRRETPEEVHLSLRGTVPSGPMPNRLEVTIEGYDETLPGDFAWRPVPGQPPAAAELAASPTELAVAIPADAGADRRLVVRELERYQSDPSPGEDGGSVADRVVYADTVPL